MDGGDAAVLQEKRARAGRFAWRGSWSVFRGQVQAGTASLLRGKKKNKTNLNHLLLERGPEGVALLLAERT